MKQLIQNLKTGETVLQEAPVPQLKPGYVLIKSVCSLISLGTERMLVEFGKAGLLAKARQQPERVKQVIDKIKTDGLVPTIQSVLARLDEPLALGYCNAGTVIGVGEGVHHFKIGDRVASNGPHAEVVLVPKHLVQSIPDNVTYDEAAFTVIGAIALQGLRLTNPTLGETVVVIGLGLVGQLSVQLALANGCIVIGFDIDENKVEIARKAGAIGYTLNGAVNAPRQVREHTENIGADAVIIAASSKSDSIIEQSAEMCRKRGRIVLVGVVGLKMKRKLFYEKELSFQVSCSYGPGRYDPQYEEKGVDYPIAHARWTEQRNFQAVLECMRQGRLKVRPLISETAEFDKAVQLYASLPQRKNLATILTYTSSPDTARTLAIGDDVIQQRFSRNTPERPLYAIVGAGNFTKATILPILTKTGAEIKYICSQGGASSAHLARKYHIPFNTTNFDAILSDESVTAVIIATRHNLHAPMVIKTLRAGKHAFVEKPLAITYQELIEIEKEYGKAIEKCRSHAMPPTVMVGFNRRFSPFAQKMHDLLGVPAPLMSVIMTVNAGSVPQNHWVQDAEIGGGRIIGEACHFIDLYFFLTQSPIISLCASNLGTTTNMLSDSVQILLKSGNGAQGAIHYLADGNKGFPKETMQIFANGMVLSNNNFKELNAYGAGKFKKEKLFTQDKGHKTQFSRYKEFLQHKSNPLISFADIMHVSKAACAILQSLQTRGWVSVV